MTRALRVEWLAVTLVAAVLAGLLPLQAGYLGWSWDALNHHVYLGLVAEHPRWELDVLPASVQTYQYPYLYWPIYRMSLWPIHPVWIAAVWSGLQAALLAAPVWLVCQRLLPSGGSAAEERLLRVSACAMAFSSVVVIASIESTANDLLAVTPLLWAVAISLKGAFDDRRAGWAAALWGMSMAFKLTHVLFLPWALLWWYRPQRPHLPARRALILLGAAMLGYAVTYCPWGWQLWQLTGNPLHPLFGHLLEGR